MGALLAALVGLLRLEFRELGPGAGAVYTLALVRSGLILLEPRSRILGVFRLLAVAVRVPMFVLLSVSAVSRLYSRVRMR